MTPYKRQDKTSPVQKTRQDRTTLYKSTPYKRQDKTSPLQKTRHDRTTLYKRHYTVQKARQDRTTLYNDKTRPVHQTIQKTRQGSIQDKTREDQYMTLYKRQDKKKPIHYTMQRS
jgi:hypothetical protein